MMKREKRGTSLSESLVVENAEERITYTIPLLDTSFGLPERPDVRHRLRLSGIEQQRLERCIAKWMRSWADQIDLVALNFTGGRYTLAVLLTEFTAPLMIEVQNSMRDFCCQAKLLGPQPPAISVVGPAQRDSFLFSPEEGGIVYTIGPSATSSPSSSTLSR